MALGALCAAVLVASGRAEDAAPVAAAPAEDAAPAAIPVAPSGLPSCASQRCPLCDLPATIPIVRLTAAAVESLGTAYSDANEATFARLDTLYAAGRFGAPGTPAAREAVRLAARMATRNAYSYVADFATDSTHVTEADESALVNAFSTFADPGLYPITRLRRARMGLGWVCLHYDLRGDLDTLATMGGKRVRVRIKELPSPGGKTRMLSMMLSTGLEDVVEVLLPEHYACRVDHVRIPGPPAPYELFVLHELRGLLLRKWGTHAPQAIMFWTTPRERALDVSVDEALLGVRIYVPELHLRLPLLPDLGFDDLREIDLPQPIVRLSYLRAEGHPDWLEGRSAGFGGWSGYGPVPAVVRERFPDR